MNSARGILGFAATAAAVLSVACAGVDRSQVARDRERLTAAVATIPACEGSAETAAPLSALVGVAAGTEVQARGLMRRGDAMCTLLLCQDCCLGVCREERCCNGCGGIWVLAEGEGDPGLALGDPGSPSGITWGAKDCSVEIFGALPAREVVARGVLEEAEVGVTGGPFAGRVLRLHGLCAVGEVREAPAR